MTGKPITSAFGTLIVAALLIGICFSSALAQRRHPPEAPDALLNILDKEDRECVLQSGLDKSVTVRPIQLAGNRRPQILVRGSGLCLCGAQNCGFWIYQKTGRDEYKLLLKGTGSTRVRATGPYLNGFRDVVSESHASAAETIIRTYQYDGGGYQLQRCVNRAYFDDNGKYTQTPTYRPCGEDSASEAVTSLPAGLLDQDLTTIDNRQLKLSTYSGRIVVVNVFIASCGPCRENISDLRTISRNVNGEIQLIGVVLRLSNTSVEPVRKLIEVLNIDFPVVWGDTELIQSLSQPLQRVVLPQTFIIDKGGHLRKEFLGFDPARTPALVREALDQIRTKTAK